MVKPERKCTRMGTGTRVGPFWGQRHWETLSSARTIIHSPNWFVVVALCTTDSGFKPMIELWTNINYVVRMLAVRHDNWEMCSFNVRISFVCFAAWMLQTSILSPDNKRPMPSINFVVQNVINFIIHRNPFDGTLKLRGILHVHCERHTICCDAWRNRSAGREMIRSCG